MQLQDLAQYLEKLAREGAKTVTYSHITSYFELDPIYKNWDSHELKYAFDILDAEDIRLGRPLRTSLVVKERELRPGKGYFKSLRKRKNSPAAKERDHTIAHAIELKELENYYKAH